MFAGRFGFGEGDPLGEDCLILGGDLDSGGGCDGVIGADISFGADSD